jgi:fatty acid/phospholipid biosynthesis enzyme
MESFIRRANEIEGDPRRWVEIGLGQQLRQDQRVMVTVLNVGVEPDEETRRQAREELRQIRAEAAANIEAQGVSSEEVDAVVDEAIARVRPRKQ